MQTIKNLDGLSRLAKAIVKAHPRGYIGAIVQGPRGKGKSVFCLVTARQVFEYVLGVNRDEAWEHVLKNIIFSLDEVDKIFDRLEGIDWDNIDRHWMDDKPIVKVWDDVGMHGGKYKYLVESKLVDHLQENLDVMRFAITGFLMNAPEVSNLLRFLRDYHDHVIIDIKGRREGGMQYERVAYFQKWKKNRRNCWQLREDPPHTPYSCFLGASDRLGINDQWVYDQFEALKGKAIVRNREKFKKMIPLIQKIEPEKTNEEIVTELGLFNGWDDESKNEETG